MVRAADGDAAFRWRRWPAAGWLLRKEPPKALLPVGRDNDVGPWIGRRWAVGAIVAVVAGMLFFALHLEMSRTLCYFYPPLRLPVLSLLWIAMCIFLLRQYRRQPSDALLAVLMFFVAGLVVKLFCFDLAAWSVAATMLLRRPTTPSSMPAMRLLDFGGDHRLPLRRILLAVRQCERPHGRRLSSAAPPWRCCSFSPPWK